MNALTIGVKVRSHPQLIIIIIRTTKKITIPITITIRMNERFGRKEGRKESGLEVEKRGLLSTQHTKG